MIVCAFVSSSTEIVLNRQKLVYSDNCDKREKSYSQLLYNIRFSNLGVSEVREAVWLRGKL